MVASWFGSRSAWRGQQFPVHYNQLPSSNARGVLEELDSWIKRKLRCLLWRQWKRPGTRTKNLQRAGLSKDRAMISAYNNNGPWWNSGASHMNQAIKNAWFRRLGLISLLEQQR
ncbi:hypothetical protein DAT27_22440 [Escherichia coli]|nr:hypothetical protein DAT27_22440 [Escherichia coli]